MPEIGLTSPVTEPVAEGGSYKIPYAHPEDPNKLILKAKREGWQQEKGMFPELTPEQQHSYVMLMYYTRRLAHLLYPDHFPAVHGINSTTMVVEKTGDPEYEGSPLAFPEERPEFNQISQALGLHENSLDHYPGNFKTTADGSVKYIDELSRPGNTYFAVLFLSQLSLGELDALYHHPEKRFYKPMIKDLLRHLDDPRSLGMTEDGRPELFNPGQLKETIAKFPSPQQEKALALLGRIEAHQAQFEPIDIAGLQRYLKLVIQT